MVPSFLRLLLDSLNKRNRSWISSCADDVDAVEPSDVDLVGVDFLIRRRGGSGAAELEAVPPSWTDDDVDIEEVDPSDVDLVGVPFTRRRRAGAEGGAVVVVVADVDNSGCAAALECWELL